MCSEVREWEVTRIQCSVCKCWVHHGKKRCTKIKGPLPKKIADIERFVCAVCKGDHAVNDQPVNENFDNESLKFVDKFCYLGDTISAGGWAEAATILNAAGVNLESFGHF